MLLKCAVVVILSVLLQLIGVQTASIQQNNIPVEVVYDEPRELQTNENKYQLKGRKNLDEKIQLSAEELSESVKHLPVDNVVELSPSEKMVKRPEEETLNRLSIIEKATQIVSTGLEDIRNNSQFKPDLLMNGWDQLNISITNFLQSEKNKLDLKQQDQNNQNFIQTITSGIQQIANNFQQSIQGNQQPVNGSEDQQGGGAGGGGGGNVFQGFIDSFQGGVQNIVNNINNIGNPGATPGNGTSSDTGTGTTPPTNFISSFVTGVQQFFGGNNQAAQQNNVTQGDTGTATQGPPNPGQVIQNFGNQIGNAFNQFLQGGQSTAKPPDAAGDETVSTTTTQRGPIQIIQGIGNAFNQFIGQTTSKPPGAAGDDGVNVTQTQQGGQNFIQNIGSAIQNLNPFRPTENPPVEGANTNPIQAGIQNVGSQLQQVVNPGTNPVDSIQNAVQGAAGSLNPSGGSTSKNEVVKSNEIHEVKKDEIMMTAE